MMKKFVFGGTLLTILIFVFVSCEYDFIVKPEVPPPNPNDTISFSKQIEPIFTDKDCISCHNTGGTQPDLTSGKAYVSIISMSLVNLQNAESSKIYVYPNPANNEHNWKKYTEAQAALVLQWINQGALDN